MKNLFAAFSVLLLLTAFSLTASAQKKQMTWTTNNEVARELAMKATDHMMNVEFPQAYEEFLQAVKLDPDFTVALVFLTNLTVGESKKEYAEKAIKSAANKTDGEKLFASLVDEKSTPDMRRDTWAKLHQTFPDGAMLEHYYVVTRVTPQERLEAAEAYVKKYPKSASMQNFLAYIYMNDMKDNAKAKMHFEKYIELYPDGYNPYDSMGEFYYNTGDMTNSEKYYTMALERYPFNSSSIQKIDDINKAKKAKVSN